MKCVIMAAGEGKRMHPLTFTRPKVMLPLAGKPILEWNLQNAIAAGFSEFVFIVAYKSEMVRSFFGDGSQWDVSIDYVNQGKALGTGHAIAQVKPFVDEFLVLSGDTIFGSADIKKVMKTPQSMALFEVEDAQSYGCVQMDDQRVIRIFEKMPEPVSNVINAGMYHFSSEIFSYIEKTPRSPRGEYEITDAINLYAEKKSLSGLMISSWRDVVYPWHLLDANAELLSSVQSNILGDVEKGTMLHGPVYIGEGTKVRAGSYIEGPVVIGKDCRIGPNCYIRPSTSIGDRCHVGHACELKNSIVMDDSHVPHQNYVGDSVIGMQCNLGAGAKVANLRFDQKNIPVVLNGVRMDSGRRKLGVMMSDHVEVGINAVMNVGTLLGDHVCVGPGARVSGEIASHSQVL